METPNNKKTNTNPALKLTFKQNPRPVSPNTLNEFLTPKSRRKTDKLKTGQLSPKKRAASNSEKMESCRKIRKPEDTNPNNFEPWSPQSKEAYLARTTDSATKNSAPTISNWTGSSREIISGRVNELNNVTKSPINPPLIDNSRKRSEEKNSMFEKSTLRIEPVTLIPFENVEINNNTLLCDNAGYLLNHNSSNVNSLSAVRTPQPNLDSLTKRVELEKQLTMGKADEQLAPNLRKAVSEDIEVIDLEEYNSFSPQNCHSPSNFDPSVQEDVKPSKSVSDPGTFKILVHGIDITSKIKEKTCVSYYNMCLAHNSYLHDNLMKGINLNDAAHYIKQTVTAWNFLKSCSLSQTPEFDFQYCVTALESLFKFGMDVNFMLTRAKSLLDLKTKDKNIVDRERAKAAKAKGEVLEEEIKAFELEIEKRREEKRRTDDEIDGIRRKAEELETMFRIVASAPLN